MWVVVYPAVRKCSSSRLGTRQNERESELQPPSDLVANCDNDNNERP